MRILFSTNKKLGSRFIRWGTGGDCSHLAIVFEEDRAGNGIVFQSNFLKGAHTLWLRDFLRENTVVHALAFSPEVSPEVEDAVFKKIIVTHSGEGYDFRAFLFWFFMGLRRRLFGTPLPERNTWEKNFYNLCTGLIYPLQKALPDYFWGPNIDWEMISPSDIYTLLSKREGFVSDDLDLIKFSADLQQ